MITPDRPDLNHFEMYYPRNVNKVPGNLKIRPVNPAQAQTLREYNAPGLKGKKIKLFYNPNIELDTKDTKKITDTVQSILNRNEKKASNPEQRRREQKDRKASLERKEREAHMTGRQDSRPELKGTKKKPRDAQMGINLSGQQASLAELKRTEQKEQMDRNAQLQDPSLAELKRTELKDRNAQMAINLQGQQASLAELKRTEEKEQKAKRASSEQEIEEAANQRPSQLPKEIANLLTQLKSPLMDDKLNSPEIQYKILNKILDKLKEVSEKQYNPDETEKIRYEAEVIVTQLLFSMWGKDNTIDDATYTSLLKHYRENLIPLFASPPEVRKQTMDQLTAFIQKQFPNG